MVVYEKEPVIDPDGRDPIEYWKQNKHRFPILSEAARKYLAVPPTTVASERAFSKTGKIYSPQRMRLEPKKAEQLLFLNCNLGRLDYSYNLG